MMSRIAFTLVASLVAAAPLAAQMEPVLPTGTIDRPVGLDGFKPLTVDAKINGGVLEVTGRIPRAQRADTSTIKNYDTCTDGSSECRLVSVRLPEETVTAPGKTTFSVRRAGGNWVELATERKTIVLDANRMFHETGARAGEYEEFARFSIRTTYMTVNCAVKNGNRLQWALMNWNGDDVEFRIRLKLHRCGEVLDDEDESS